MIKNEVLKMLEKNKGSFIKGQSLANDLNVSRNTIWKAINSLKKEGYDIESVTNKGYKLNEKNDIVSNESVHIYLNEKNKDYFIDSYDVVESTNIIAKKKAQEGFDKYVAYANGQSAGRGRHGKSFYSPKDTGMYFSVIIRKKMPVEKSLFITAAVSVAVYRAIKTVLKIDTQIKWVNDIFYKDKKVCGISTEANIDFLTGFFEYAILGIGINLYTVDFPGELEDIATNLLDKKCAKKSQLLAQIINNIEDILYDLDNKDFLDDYKKNSYIIGKDIYILQGDEKIEAKAVDINDNCHLIAVTKDQKTIELSSSEVSIRKIK